MLLVPRWATGVHSEVAKPGAGGERASHAVTANAPLSRRPGSRDWIASGEILCKEPKVSFAKRDQQIPTLRWK